MEAQTHTERFKLQASSFKLPPLAAYIHIPWCVRKCPYCDFNSHVSEQGLPEAEYIDALIADLELDLPNAQGRELTSIFFGGGTPSLFSAESLGRLLDAMANRLNFATDIEITLEANPGTFEQVKFAGYRAAGINRLSIGIQSFNAKHLKALGRIHDDKEALAAVAMARKAGFDNLNLDLMHGLPDQSLDDALADINQAIDLGPEHLSWYQLTLEPNTVFYSKPPILPVEDTLWAIQEAGQARLAEAGLAQYEISAYAQPGRQARHNLNYWQYGDFLGIGAGAHGKLTHPDGRVERYWKTRLPRDYLDAAKDYCAGRKVIAAADLPFDFLMNALRLSDGVPTAYYLARTGQSLEAIAPQLNEAVRKGLLEPWDQQLRPTERGRLFLNDLLEMFL
ncbi:radical SAM family heme chaperone HemW [Halopseudomonas pelagia]|uniref:Heme chaperone HemW n=1 Tax=Halopseudomonas pelagia TaxID=553151 RepID=A0AA91U3P0_9GAMM|nr:radical SAM family heme chaperone HemW [Halopseudomonas pelagia]PCC99401.1 YggW family oxidoreductase [Halopseudomonas pelagia]QFY58654.1 radical SAM family heme chaperone HemW [Halopseudomonas pelagia]